MRRPRLWRAQKGGRNNRPPGRNFTCIFRAAPGPQGSSQEQPALQRPAEFGFASELPRVMKGLFWRGAAIGRAPLSWEARKPGVWQSMYVTVLAIQTPPKRKLQSRGRPETALQIL
jgi:hypothetical protein